MAHPEHPLISPHGTHAAPDLVCEGLKGDLMINGCQRARDGFTGTDVFLDLEKLFQRFLKTALQQVLKALERDHARRPGRQFPGQMETVNRIEEKQGPDPFVEVVAAAAKGLQFRSGSQQFICGQRGANGVKRLIAN